jgi:hypothetical protein
MMGKASWSVPSNQESLDLALTWHHIYSKKWIFTRQGKSYEDSKAAISKRGNAAKQPLTSTPFVIEFEYGANNDGYWAYEHMVLQLEDCIDVLHCLYPQYDLLFMFDHSCGHDRQREDGLNVENMSRNYWGKQSKLRTSLIKQEKGYLGHFPCTLNPGDVQSMVFLPGDEGPFWMMAEQRQSTRLDVEIQGKTMKNEACREGDNCTRQHHEYKTSMRSTRDTSRKWSKKNTAWLGG